MHKIPQLFGTIISIPKTTIHGKANSSAEILVLDSCCQPDTIEYQFFNISFKAYKVLSASKGAH
jgi:hypothetical protein